MSDFFYSPDNKQAQSSIKTIPVMLGAMTREDGTVLTKFTSNTDAWPGFSQESNKEIVLRWNNVGTPTAAAFSVPTPIDLDTGKVLTVHWLAAMSGATDSPEITHEVYLGAGDTDAAGTDDEIDGGVTVTEYTATVLATDLPDHPSMITVIFKPKAGEVGTDDTLIYAVWIEYTALSSEVAIDGTDRIACRINVPYAHKLVSASLITENIVQVGTLAATLKQTDLGDARGGATLGTALDNTTLEPDNTNRHKRLDFVLKDEDLLTAPANRCYFVTLTGTDPADRITEPQLMIEVARA